MDYANPKNRAIFSFTFSVPIGFLGGLIGLGGAEFRLPVLVGPFRYSARQAVPLNLAISMVTIVASIVTRSHTVHIASLSSLWPAVFALIGGAVVAAFFGTGLAKCLSDQLLERVILVLLSAIGVALIVEGCLPDVGGAALLPADLFWQIGGGILFGLCIGLVSSLLGVAGGELIIPTLVFAYGADIKIAGTASLLISLPTVFVGLVRYARQGAFAERVTLSETVLPMGLGSIVGAIAGAFLAGVVPSGLLKVVLGVILVVSAIRIFRRTG